MRLGHMGEGIRLAIDQLLANRFRTALTVLGIVVGVATVMTMSALIAGIRSGVIESIEAVGPKNFMVARFDWNNVRLVSDGSEPPWGDNPPVTVQELERLTDLDHVSRVIAGLNFSGTVEAGTTHLGNVQLEGRGLGWGAYTAGAFTAGSDFLPADVRASHPVAVLSVPLADALFGPLNPIGREIRISGRSFSVSGVFELEGNIFADAVEYWAIMPYTAAIKHLNVSDEMVSGLVVTAPAASQVEAIDGVITALRTMRGLRPGDPNDFAVVRQEEMTSMFNQLTGVFFAVMLALSSVALMVGGVGVVAVMMIAVTERTREIGIRKALGARRREILWQFLIEAATLTLAGAALGLLIGAGAALLVRITTPVPAEVPFAAVVAALAMAGVAGILFGIWPAWRAARLDPVVALRHE